MKYVPLFILIQLINLPLMLAGLVICLWPTFALYSHLWWNSDDPPTGSWWHQYYWLAIRNPVANLRHVPGVSGKGRPLYYRNWIVKGRQFYFKCGWMSDGYPCLSAGSGRGY